MNQNSSRVIIGSVIAAALITVVVVFAAFSMLRGTDAGDSQDPSDADAVAAEETPASAVEPRPLCPAEGAGGIALPCLGAESGADGVDKQVTVVNVWAWWCGPCRDELPYFDEFAAEHPEFEVVGVHADTNAANGAAMLNELGIELASYQDDDNTFAGTLGLPGVIPITVVFDGEEQIAMFPRTFESAADIAAAVDGAVAGEGTT